MSSLGALLLTGSSRSKGGSLKGFVGRLTGRGKNSAKASPAQVHSFLDDDVSNYQTSPETTTPRLLIHPGSRRQNCTYIVTICSWCLVTSNSQS
jgi:hypothetical protein